MLKEKGDPAVKEQTKLTEFLEGPPLVTPVKFPWPVEDSASQVLTPGQFTIWLTGTGSPSVRSPILLSRGLLSMPFEGIGAPNESHRWIQLNRNSCSGGRSSEEA